MLPLLKYVYDSYLKNTRLLWITPMVLGIFFATTFEISPLGLLYFTERKHNFSASSSIYNSTTILL